MGVHSNGKRPCLLGESGDFAIGFWFGSPPVEAAVCSLVVDRKGLLEKTVERKFTTSLQLPIRRTASIRLVAGFTVEGLSQTFLEATIVATILSIGATGDQVPAG